MSSIVTKRCLYLLFALSGFSGLIYESIWSRYLTLFLGHAAYAQALVLVIFMGGLAIGAWLVSRYTHQLGNLLLCYAVIEGTIGLFGLVFNPVFQFVFSVSFGNIIPALGDPVFVYTYKIIIASLLILPQSLLLGATFPLMSGGFIRKFPGLPGQSISILYFLNSFGAAIGLLFSAFYLVGKLGLPGTIFAAGIVNIVIAILVYVLVKAPAPLVNTTPATILLSRPGMFLAISFFTGMASFIYEISWIRMLSMVLGTSTYSFELMLSAFIIGLAMGGYLIRKRIDHLQDPIMFVAFVQILMGLFAILTIFLYGYSFELMAFFMSALGKTEQAYILFSLFSHGIALLIMLPATICAGMTLPLFTYILLKQGQGEKSIGQIYSSNTIGAIAGVLFTVFVGMPMLGTKGSVLSGAVIDISLGMVLLWIYSTSIKIRYQGHIAAAVAIILIITVIGFEFNTKVLASGVFRHGIAQLDDKTEILFHQDGKTASVTVSEWDNKTVTIMTNGKPDATITMASGSPPSIDEATMTLLGALPLSVYPKARTIANIGMGSGLTTHTVLAMPGVERIDTIEIEAAIIKGAEYFIPKTGRVFNDPRSYIQIDDARTYFSIHQSRYDIIISEPSNPWVSGVSSLFTTEFYQLIRSHLNQDGLLAQWIHIYELNTELLISILKAISLNFPYYSIYFADDGDLILLASVDNPVNIPDYSIFESADMKNQLATVHIHNLEDMRFRFLGDQNLFNPFINQSKIDANSDYYPVLDLRAEKSRFLQENVSELLNLRLSSPPILDILYDNPGFRTENLSRTDYFPDQHAEEALKIYDYFSQKVFDKAIISSIASLNFLTSAAITCDMEYNQTVWTDSFYIILSKTIGLLTRKQLDEILVAITPQCEVKPGLELQYHWLNLFKSFNAQNDTETIAALVELLDTTTEVTLEQQKFLYITLLTMFVKTGDHVKASLLWNQYMKYLFIDVDSIPMEIQILLAVIEDRK